MTEAQRAATETLSFQAEVKQLLHLMIHSLYSNREIFLRELISNASDACDKLRFESLDRPELLEGGGGELAIRIGFDKAARTVTIADNGIGMSREEVIAHLGTIAKSGTKEFFSRLTGDQQRDAHLIGQFGVGFYSAFIVADKVTVLTRRAGLDAEQGVKWECAMTGETAGEYTVEPVAREFRGTEIILHLREDQDDLLSGWRLRSIIRKYSDHIAQPIRMQKEEWDAEKNEQVLRDEEETVNQASALWARSKSDITDEQYKEFYKHVAHDHEDPLAWSHARVEGRHEYTQLLYIPAHAPFDLWDRNAKHGLKLYVRRVFIMDDAEKLLPYYLRFVRGVVDSNDLPLNVSREILQEGKDIDTIRAGCAKKVLGLLEDLAENEKDKYATFWGEFGKALKEGVGEDFANRERIAKLLRFATTQADTPEQSVSLADYVARMKEGQDKIYYVTADTFTAAKNSPHLEIFRKKGIEVLLLAERVDEWLVSHLNEFEGKQVVSVARGDLDLGKLEDEAEKKAAEAEAGEFKDMLEKVKASLGERVKEVRITHRLTDSPACVVADDNEMGTNLARLLKAAGQDVPSSAPILELNPRHPVVLRLKYGSEHFDDWAAVLLDQALLAEGGSLEDPAGFVKRINLLMVAA
ncbi:molecular chaperone HtpG [Niveibacterium sp. SC-1]|uniref:molecular chaperone HtpG n=1 Tax=Niveibacterium sp. SC-1 TaxID=3135646 RepID=UPI00311E8F2E